MRPGFTEAIEFSQIADTIRDPAQLHATFGEVVGQFGAQYFSTIVVSRVPRGETSRFLFGNVVEAWTKRYDTANYAVTDPSVAMLLNSRKPFSWAEAALAQPREGGQRLLDENRDYTGATDGFVIPFHDRRGETSAVILSGAKAEFSAETRPLLHMAALYFSSVGRDIVQGGESVDVCPLTARQLECLRWVMDGKSDWEIGEILTISERTAHNHVEAAKVALGVSTRTQAVVQAWRRGWLV